MDYFIIIIITSLIFFLKYYFLDFPIVPMHQFAEPGEILKEFEAEQHKLSKQEEDRRKEEERASVDLIAQLQQQQVMLLYSLINIYAYMQNSKGLTVV